MAAVPPAVWEVTRRWGDEVLSVDYVSFLSPPLPDGPGTLALEDGTEIVVRAEEIPEEIGLGLRVDRPVVLCMAVSIAIHVALFAWIFLVPPAALAIATL